MKETAMDLEAYILKNDECIWRVIHDETFLISKDGKYIHKLDEIGTEIWQKIEGNNTVTDIINHICSIFDVEEETAKQDVIEFIQQLSRLNIVALKGKNSK